MNERPNNDGQSDQGRVGGWQTSTPEAQGVESRGLIRVLTAIRDRNLNVHSLHVVRAGYLVLDACFWPYQSVWPHDLASVTKSFTSTLIGIAIDKGHIPGVHTRLVDLFPGRTIGHLDELKRAITLEHLLTMSSGLECICEPTELTLERMWHSTDWAQFMLDLPMTDAPGSCFKYSSGGAHLLSAILTEATGLSACEFARQHLFGPLGFQKAIWPSDFSGRSRGWGDLMITPYDMAKLGYLFLNGGRWNGQQIVSTHWVKEATMPRMTVDESRRPLSGYGYQWWTTSEGAFVAKGRAGQRIFVVPASDMVIVTTSALPRHDEQDLDHLVLDGIVPAARSATPLSSDWEALGVLSAMVQDIAQPPKDAPAVVPMPDMYLVPNTPTEAASHSVAQQSGASVQGAAS